MLNDRWIRAVVSLVLSGIAATLVYQAGRAAGLREAVGQTGSTTRN